MALCLAAVFAPESMELHRLQNENTARDLGYMWVVVPWPWVVAAWLQGEPFEEAPKRMVGAEWLLLFGWVGQPVL